MEADRPAQSVIAPFATLLTTFLWLETWIEIVSRGARHSPDDLSKIYLTVMAAYAGAAEISKWLVNAPTDPTLDPRFERIQRGGFFIGLWLAPLLFAYSWRITNPQVPMPEPLQKTVLGLIGIFFLKAASRKLRHKKHGVIDPTTGEVNENTDGDGLPDAEEPKLSETLLAKIKSGSDGMTIGEIFAAYPEVTKPRLYRALDKLLKAESVVRTGKPRTPDVRYREHRTFGNPT
jgi:hypothetical protein